MNCQEARELFSAKADERLTPEQRLALDGHFQSCATCPREWERFRQTVSLLHSLEEARAPAGFARRVIENLRQEPWPRRLLRSVFLPLHVKLPLEAAAVVLLSTLVILLYRQTPEFERAVEAPPSRGAPAPAAKSADLEGTQRSGEVSPAPQATPPASEEHQGAPRDVKEKDRLEKKEAAAPAEAPAVGGRMDLARGAAKSAPARSEPRLPARARGPFHLVGLLRPRDPATVDSQLSDLVKEVGGILVRDAERVRAGSIVEVVLSREAYPRLETGLRQIGDFTVESRAPTFPDQVKVALRIAD